VNSATHPTFTIHGDPEVVMKEGSKDYFLVTEYYSIPCLVSEKGFVPAYEQIKHGNQT